MILRHWKEGWELEPARDVMVSLLVSWIVRVKPTITCRRHQTRYPSGSVHHVDSTSMGPMAQNAVVVLSGHRDRLWSRSTVTAPLMTPSAEVLVYRHRQRQRQRHTWRSGFQRNSSAWLPVWRTCTVMKKLYRGWPNRQVNGTANHNPLAQEKVSKLSRPTIYQAEWTATTSARSSADNTTYVGWAEW